MPESLGQCFRVGDGAGEPPGYFISCNTVTESGMLPKGLRHRSRCKIFKEFRGCLTKLSPDIVPAHSLPFADLSGAAVLMSVRQMCDHFVESVMFVICIFSRGCRAKPVAGCLRFWLRMTGDFASGISVDPVGHLGASLSGADGRTANS